MPRKGDGRRTRCASRRQGGGGARSSSSSSRRRSTRRSLTPRTRRGGRRGAGAAASASRRRSVGQRAARLGPERAAAAGASRRGGHGRIAPAVAPAAAPAGGGGSVGGGDVEVAPSESAELTELRIELVASKIQVAEAMFDAEQYRGQVSRLQKQLDRLGGSQLETAQRSTQMEVQLAQALSEVAALRSDNEKLSSDVAQMIEMRLQDAESRAGS